MWLGPTFCPRGIQCAHLAVRPIPGLNVLQGSTDDLLQDRDEVRFLRDRLSAAASRVGTLKSRNAAFMATALPNITFCCPPHANNGLIW
ncbi:hypothetical protein [Xanthobacter flavus]